MPPPFRARTPESLGRDVQIISRLRMAMKLDATLPRDVTESIVKKLDDLIESLLPLLDHPSTTRPASRLRVGRAATKARAPSRT